ncbi:hypothetical protein N7510_008120 [Penicillium lagena]|uniref:uncharacterized protein n=1 Tax=Penicillium lagena TaxID=94218 RepID=UPI002540DA63|nr:uncharacterized protein N7510_008120 [Penicillium lagena]KAJ5611401.1 hypothetical protein N7510_008120 [Penicillium lagena]
MQWERGAADRGIDHVGQQRFIRSIVDDNGIGELGPIGSRVLDRGSVGQEQVLRRHVVGGTGIDDCERPRGRTCGTTVVISQRRDYELAVLDGCIGGVKERLRVAPAHLAKDVALHAGQAINAIDRLQDRGLIRVQAILVEELEHVPIETKPEGDAGVGRQLGDDRGYGRSLVLIDDQRVIDRDGSGRRVNHGSLGISLLEIDALRARGFQNKRSGQAVG